MTQLQFFRHLFPAIPGKIEVRRISPDKTLAKRGYFSDISLDLLRFSRKDPAVNIYFGPALRDGRGGKKENIIGTGCLWVDIDKPCLDLPKDLPGPSIIVSSGHGFHVYWLLTKFYRTDTRTSRHLIEGLLRGLAEKCSADASSTDISRLLRAPETLNLKGDVPVESKVLSWNGTRYPLDAFLPFKARVTMPVRTELDPQTSHGLETLIRECGFLQHCRDNAETLSEPLWYAMISNMAVFEGGREAIHRFSMGHPKYSGRETEYKIRRALNNTRPHTCDYVKRMGFFCRNCPWQGVIKSPAGIPYKIKKGDAAWSTSKIKT
ncbi:MAG TPA: hypothetical protein ENN18_01580 [Proteobacteria bacterium]|nr:hypothetical protein [Pseudomonadota bacterium]